MHDKMDHAKTASPVVTHKTKHLNGLTKLPLSMIGMLAHGHGDVTYAHYGLDLYPHDANYIVGLFAKLLWDLELPPKSFTQALFQNAQSTPLYEALLHGAEAYESSLPPPMEYQLSSTPLPPILNVQMDNATGDNKNKFIFCFWSLLVANKIFREVYVNFMIVGHTHDDIDALFGRWSMALKKESFPTIPLLMKSFMDVEAVPTIPHLIKEVPNFKGRFTLWPKVERPSVSTNQISRNQEFGLSTLHTRGRSPKSVAFFLPTWQHFFDQSDGLSKGVWVVQEWKPKVWSRGRRIFSLKKLDSDKI